MTQQTAPSPSLAARLASWLREVQTAEAPAVDLLAAIAPYLAPAFPAAYTWHNVSFVLLSKWGLIFSVPVGFFVACGVEAVGISAVHTIIGLWGREKSDELIRLAGLSLGMYLVIVVGANVALDFQDGKKWIPILASALLCFMTVTGGIIAGVRARIAREAAEKLAKDAAAQAQTDKAKESNKELNATAFAQGMERMRQQNAHEETQLQIQADKEIKLAKIAMGIDPDAPAKPVNPTINPTIDTIKTSIETRVDELTAEKLSKSDIVRRLISEVGYSQADIARAVGVNPALVTRIKQELTGK